MSRILLVEDSKVQALVARRQLEEAGYAVEHVATAEEAIQACYDRTPDLVVLDQNLGEDSGTSVCRRIKSDLALSVIPVLVLTASDRGRDHVEALEAGGDAFLPKGSPWPEVLAVVGRLLETRTAWQPSERNRQDTPSAAHRTRALAVDDSPTFLELLCRGLTNAGFATTGAPSGDGGLLLLTQQPFDLAVVDVVMAGMDGFEFCRRARQWAVAEGHPLGLLILTGAERKDVLMQSLDAGADDYVSKSQDLDVIVAHAAALARRVTRTRQIAWMSEQTLRQQLALQETELKRRHAAEQARLREQLERVTEALAQAKQRLAHFTDPPPPD